MRIDILSKEYLPGDLRRSGGPTSPSWSRALRERGDLDVRVHAFGEPREEDGRPATPTSPSLAGANAALTTLGVDLSLAAACEGADLVHSHTWYANMGGHLASLMGDIPHVLTAHSLEPMRPWKAEQLGGGYRVSSWVEKTAYEAADAVIAVSAGMREDILRSYPSIDPDKVKVVHNGIDSQLWRAERDEDVVRRHGVDPDRPSVIFVGRITRQKGLPYLLRAAAELPPEVQLVLLAGAPDTPEIKAEVESLIDTLRETRDGVVWVPTMLPRNEVVAMLTAATVFVCPSVYEPLGIVNLEAMACELPGGRHRDRGHPRGRRARRDRLAGAHRAGAGRHRYPGRPRPLRRRPRCRPDGCRERHRSRRPDGPRGPSPGGGVVLLGLDRRADQPGLPGRPEAPDAVVLTRLGFWT